ncbi:MAG TPA: class I SAM-dependent methyltransferase [Actinomycetota bacterium]|nr:class I SAM-dependent methyltransferase [Actinomycetota bacterium]
MAVERTRFAKRLFAGIAPQYERMGALLSFGQDARWRRFLVSRSNAVPGGRVLDVAAGTQLVSRAFAASRHVHVVALDQSEPMLRAGGEPNRLAGLEGRIRPVLGQAEHLPFGDGSFDSVSFTYLLRYVDDPAATVDELARVLRTGGSIAMLEFSVPEAPLARLGWWIQTRVVMRLVGTAVSPAWAGTTAFLGPNISRFVADHPIEEWVRWFQAAGIRHVRTRSFLFGSAVVLWGVKSS